MTKSELIAILARSTGISKTDTKIITEALFKTIKEKINQGESLYLRRFGTFSLKVRKEKIGRDMNKKISLLIPSRKFAHFKQSSVFFKE